MNLGLHLQSKIVPKQSFDIENKEELVLIPRHNDSCKEIGNKLNNCDQIWKRKVYMQKKNVEIEDGQTLQHCHESELREN